ncbi:MAG: hypothetical protein AAGG11_16520 [Pseudomonadota bacterium]
MAFISINDLTEDQALDAAAMQAVFGGRQQSLAMAGELSYRLAATSRFEESELVPGLVKTQDLRLIPEDS